MAMGRILRQVHRARAVALLSSLLLVALPASAKNWSSEKYVDPGIDPVSTRFAIQDKQYKLIEQKNRFGHVVRQTLIGEGFIQNSIDLEGDGRLDSWELKRPDSTTTLSYPQKGRFTRMDVEKQYPQGTLHMLFYRNSKGAFQLVSSNATPYAPMHKADDGDQYLSAGCRSGEMRLQDRAITTMQAIFEPDTDADLRKGLADEAMTKECKQGEFANNRTKIIDGIMSVLKSDAKESIGPKPSQKPATKGTFLQCLRYYDLDLHATRITSAFSNYIHSIKNDGFKWQIRCDTNSKDAGAFEQKFAPILPIVVLGPAARQNAVDGDLTTAYAATFFHEMLHYSMIADEKTTSAIEKCCSQKGGETGASCKEVEQIVRVQKRARVFENIFRKQFGDKYAQYMDSLKKQFGKKIDIDKEMHRFFTEAATRFEKIKSDCGVKEGELTGECKARFNRELKQVINDEFGDKGNGRCEKAAADQSTAQAYCETLKQVTFEKFGINLDGLNGKNYCDNRKSSLSNWLVANVYADGGDDLQTVCDIKNSPSSSTPPHMDETNSDLPDLQLIVPVGPITPAPVVLSPLPLPPVVVPGDRAQGFLIPTPQKNEQAGEAGKNANPDPTGPSQNFGPSKPVAGQGPKGTLYSDSPTEREGQILDSLQHQNDSESRVSRIADDLAKQAFQPAQAKESEQVKNDSKKQDVNLLSYDRPQSNTLSSQPVARFPSVSDPLPPSRSIASIDSPSIASSQSSLASSSVGPVGALTTNSAKQGSSGGVPPDYKPVYQYRYGSGHKFFPVAGLSGPGGALPDGNEKKPVNLSKLEVEAHEKKSLIVFLQGPYATVRTELDNARFVEELSRYAIQVVDDSGKAYGSGAPSAKLSYDERVKRLVIVSSRVSKADQ